MEELERQKEKYDALEKTWMAANQQFMEFQVCSDCLGNPGKNLGGILN